MVVVYALVALAILFTMALSLYRAYLGPTLFDRILALNAYGTKLVSMPLFAQNLFGEQAVFLLSR